MTANGDKDRKFQTKYSIITQFDTIGKFNTFSFTYRADDRIHYVYKT